MSNQIALYKKKELLTRGVSGLREKQQQILKDTQRKNTLKAYKADFAKVQAFCLLDRLDENGRVETKGFQFLNLDSFEILRPLLPKDLIDYATFKAQDHFDDDGALIHKREKYSTIQRTVFAISKIHKLNSKQSPYTENVKDYLSRLKEHLNEEEEQAQPITIEMLLNAVRSIDVKTNRGKRDKAILLTGFFGCLRRSEIANLEFCKKENTKAYLVELPNHYLIKLLKTKRHYSGGAIEKAIKKAKAVNAAVCPVRALTDWLGAAKICTDRIFVRVAKNDRILCDKPLTTKSINAIVQNYFGAGYSAHSLRVGFCVSAYNSGASIDSIRIMGGWKTDAMPIHYTKEASLLENEAVNIFDL